MVLDRRSLFQGAAAVAGAAAASTTASQTAKAGTLHSRQASRAEHQFLRRGLHLGAWVTTPQTHRWYPSASQIRALNINSLTYYEKDFYNLPLQSHLARHHWSMAVYPTGQSGGHLTGPPKPGQSLLTSPQKENVREPFTLCFGDEEDFSHEVVEWLRQWYGISREQAPETLCHNNQWSGQFSPRQLRYYVKHAQPDLLTYDAYYFNSENQYPGGSVTPLYNGLHTYRNVAIAGADGSRNHPLAFGQYTQGFLGGSDYTYVPSESETNLVSYVTWAMGGKWTNLFRLENDWGFLLNDTDGKPTPQFYQYAELQARGRRLSPYLVRLRTSRVRLLRGRHLSDGSVKKNPACEISDWAGDKQSVVTNISVKNIGKQNSGLPGDVLIGEFLPLQPRQSPRLPDVHSMLAGGIYVMIVNCLCGPNHPGTSRVATGGTSREMTQRIRIGLDAESISGKMIYRVNQESGRVVKVARERRGDHWTVELKIPGGQAELLLIV